ncbi:hypothetical protein HYZ97_04215 [Candidatus Pacearchaeota archaeon]|nr:hypothetical protein [Candidatus Pacearchaeota archaeon]
MRGQVWIETVLYTLIGLALIGMVLGFAYPKISAAQEKVLVEQTLNSLRDLNTVINTVIEQGPGNRRSYEFGFKRGEFIINASNDALEFILSDLKSFYSEPDALITEGPLTFVSFEGPRAKGIHIRLLYTGYANITYGPADTLKLFTPAPTSYRFSITNEGLESSGVARVSFEESSGK